jgi:hypothetical protein
LRSSSASEEAVGGLGLGFDRKKIVKMAEMSHEERGKTTVRQGERGIPKRQCAFGYGQVPPL